MHAHGYDVLQLLALQKVAITGTLVNPRNFELRFEALNHLLSFFDIQEKIDHQLELLKSKSGYCGMPEEIEGYSDLTTMQVLLENVIQDSCNYVSYGVRIIIMAYMYSR